MTDDATPWGTGLTVATFVALVTAGAVVVLSMGLIRVHPLLAVGLNMSGWFSSAMEMSHSTSPGS